MAPRATRRSTAGKPAKRSVAGVAHCPFCVFASAVEYRLLLHMEEAHPEGESPFVVRDQVGDAGDAVDAEGSHSGSSSQRLHMSPSTSRTTPVASSEAATSKARTDVAGSGSDGSEAGGRVKCAVDGCDEVLNVAEMAQHLGMHGNRKGRDLETEEADDGNDSDGTSSELEGEFNGLRIAHGELADRDASRSGGSDGSGSNGSDGSDRSDGSDESDGSDDSGSSDSGDEQAPANVTPRRSSNVEAARPVRAPGHVSPADEDRSERRRRHHRHKDGETLHSHRRRSHRSKMKSKEDEAAHEHRGRDHHHHRERRERERNRTRRKDEGRHREHRSHRDKERERERRPSTSTMSGALPRESTVRKTSAPSRLSWLSALLGREPKSKARRPDSPPPEVEAQAEDKSVVPAKGPRLGKAELGKYAFEERMPDWLAVYINKGFGVTQSKVIPLLKQLLEQSSTTEYAYLCDPCVQHVSRLRKEGGFCGYRNIQTMVSYIVGAKYPGHNLFGDDLPTIFDIQNLIENAWDMGISEQGRAETGGIRLTRKYIGTPEALAMFRSLTIACNAQAFQHRKTGRAVDLLLREVERYFQMGRYPPGRKVRSTTLPPIYWQHPGHSLTIVGIEKTKTGRTNLLVFDPIFKGVSTIARALGQSTKPKHPEALLQLYRRGLRYLDRYKAFEILKLEPRPEDVVQLEGDGAPADDGAPGPSTPGPSSR